MGPESLIRIFGRLGPRATEMRFALHLSSRGISAQHHRIGTPAASQTNCSASAQDHAPHLPARRQAPSLLSQGVTPRVLDTDSGGMTSRAPKPAATASPGEALGSIDGPGERVGRIGCVTQHDPERR